jgi:HlyD family secretion protein
MRKWLFRIGIVVILVALVVVLKMTVFAPKPIPVTVAEATMGRVEETVSNSKSGTVKTRQSAHLSPEVGGRVVALPHREGSHVKAGDVLLRLDDSTLKAQLLLEERNLQEAQATREQSCFQAKRATQELERYQKLAEQQIVSQDILDGYKTSHESAEAACTAAGARVQSSRASIEMLHTDIAKTVLRAPFDGVVAERTIEVGEYATPSPPGIPMPAVLELINNKSIYISAPMDEVDSARLHAGQMVRVSLDPYPKEEFPGRIVRVAPYVLDVELQNRTVEIEVELEDAAFASRLLPGTSADVEVILSVKENVLRIPTPTILEGDRVFVVKEGRLEEHKIKTGLRNWDFTEVTGGLAAGDRVVSSLDRPEIKAGARVVIQEKRKA